jgi:hypothetical protein
VARPIEDIAVNLRLEVVDGKGGLRLIRLRLEPENNKDEMSRRRWIRHAFKERLQFLINKRINRLSSTNGLEQRGANRYYYRKEREGARVKLTYIGRGDLAHTIANFQSKQIRTWTSVQSVPLKKTLRRKFGIGN